VPMPVFHSGRGPNPDSSQDIQGVGEKTQFLIHSRSKGGRRVGFGAGWRGGRESVFQQQKSCVGSFSACASVVF